MKCQKSLPEGAKKFAKGAININPLRIVPSPTSAATILKGSGNRIPIITHQQITVYPSCYVAFMSEES